MRAFNCGLLNLLAVLVDRGHSETLLNSVRLLAFYSICMNVYGASMVVGAPFLNKSVDATVI